MRAKLLNVFEKCGEQVKEEGYSEIVTELLEGLNTFKDKKDAFFRFVDYQQGNESDRLTYYRPGRGSFHTKDIISGQIDGDEDDRFVTVLSKFLREFAKNDPEGAYLFATNILTNQNEIHLGENWSYDGTAISDLPRKLSVALGFVRKKFVLMDPEFAFEVGSRSVQRIGVKEFRLEERVEYEDFLNLSKRRTKTVRVPISGNITILYDKTLANLAKKYLKSPQGNINEVSPIEYFI